ncbi:orotidine-5'-phosphate decarboxylase [Bifidobacterium bohemicum]|uniref:Orotidine 5'-phosphate decarboxylase n=1 Tax=Bifidobacterium bohemicum DSM 22767 TaxID=1437606 RepID=A0A086ZJL8_9BIFI|nr:orotidine-5'-phosphate decarboxylase [Bifidobacterium bohemicum]KFI46718.1 orotidine 5'-phosphate decarboxylase [Bifidobacterium bohemicum DSM 22767]SCB79682.1 orotidine-5'-phosphate decarboxylase [Bifidobacterium bohemicum]
MDRLIEAIEAKESPVVVGLDPTEALVPPQVTACLNDFRIDDVDRFITDLKASDSPDDKRLLTWLNEANESETRRIAAAAMARSAQFSGACIVMGFYRFNQAVIDAVKDIVPAVKPQVAMYEAYGSIGFDAYRMTCQYAQEQGLYVLGDIKRGDIGSTAAAYAKHLTGVNSLENDCNGQPWREDAVTVNPYFGVDGIRPFTDAAKANDRDVFALVRTSNPSSREIQELELVGGERLYEHVADLVEKWGSDSIGAYGYSRLGAVVGATHPEQGRALRERMPHTFFLVPGYGAQGGTAQDAANMFDADGRGAIVNSSRGIIGAWKKSEQWHNDMTSDEALDLVGRCAREAAIAMRDDLRTALHER